MTDTEIMKALEHEIHLANDIGDVHSMMIRIGLIKDALDLLKRKDAEIERLKFIAARDESRHQTSESDRRYACGVLWDSLEKETEENRRLQAEIERLNLDKCRILHECSNRIIDAVSEAIKEFAERVKTKVNLDLCEAIDCSDYLYDLPKLIDNLVKEMVGDEE